MSLQNNNNNVIPFFQCLFPFVFSVSLWKTVLPFAGGGERKERTATPHEKRKRTKEKNCEEKKRKKERERKEQGGAVVEGLCSCMYLLPFSCLHQASFPSVSSLV